MLEYSARFCGSFCKSLCVTKQKSAFSPPTVGLIRHMLPLIR